MPANPPPEVESQKIYDARFRHMDEKFDGVNARMDGFDVRFTGLEGSLALMGAKTESLANGLADIKGDIRNLISNINLHREQDANRPSSVRTATLFQVLGLVLASSTLVSAFMYAQLSPLRAEIANAKETAEQGRQWLDHESSNRHSEQQSWIDQHSERIDQLRDSELKQFELHGAITKDISSISARITTTEKTLADHVALEGHPGLTSRISAVEKNVERIDTQGTIGALKMINEALQP